MKFLKVMSRYLIILTLLVFGKDILAQVKIGNNPKVMLPGALLELEHDSKALVITRVTTTQMNAIQANEGMLVYNTTDSCIYQRTSTAWKSLCSGANITSQNLTNGRGIIVMDGTGAVLKATTLRIDSSEIAKMMGERPIIDTLAKLIGRAPIKESVVQIIKDSISTIIQNGNITGKNAQGSEIIKVNGGTGAVLKDMNITVDTAKMMTLISNNLNKSPLKDSLSTSITNIINNNGITGKSMTSGNLVTLSGTPTGSLLKDVNIDINTAKMKDSIASWINDKPISDSITKYVSNDATIIKTMKDSVIKEITNGTVAGKDVLGSEIIKVNGGTGAALKDMNITVDTSKMMTLISNNLNKSPIKDSLATSITNIINNNGVTGKNATQGSLITVTGGSGAVLKDMKVEADTNAMKTFIANNLNKSPMKDSITKLMKDSISSIISSGSVTGKNATQGSLITVTGGSGAVLKDMKVEADTNAMKTFIANNLNKSPMKDSITKLMKDSISTIISSGSVTGKNAIQGSLITVTGGSGAVLKDMKVEADTAAMKTFIANNLNSSPIKDSLGTSITNIINNNGVTGKDISNGNGIIVTGGAGAALKATSLRIDSTAIAKMINQSPVKDSVTKLMKDSISSIISSGSVTGKNTSAGSLITVTGGAGSALKDNSIAVDTTAMKTFIANNLNSSPIKDSLGTSITNIINNNGVTGKDISNGNGIIVTGGAGAALKATSLRIDSTAIAKMINQSPVKDSITKLVKDSISSIISSGSVTGKNATQGSLITVTGGSGAVLKDMKVEADTNAMKTFIANNLNKSPMKDSITKLMKDSISTIISSGSVTGKNTTAGSLITVTGGAGSALKDNSIAVDTAAMKTFIANNLNSSPIKDSLGTSITNIINNNGVTGKDISNGNGIIVTGGAGASLKATSLRIDSTAIAKMINQSPVKDSVTKLMKDSISSIISSGSVTGKNATQGSLITVTGGSGAVLKDMKVEADTAAMKTFIANNLNKSPMKDSITKLVKDSISSIITSGSVTGNNATQGSLITVTGGTGAVLKDMKVEADTNAMKTFIANNLNKSPMKDSITKLMKDSISTIISSGSVTGKNTTAGSLITVTGGAGSALKDNSVAVDTTAMKTFIANNLNSSPIKDSLGTSITNIINNNGVTGKDISNGNGIIVTGGAGAALKATSLRIDSTAIAKMINQSPVKDSVTKLMKDSISSIITNGSINGKSLTGVGINVSANGATSLLKDVTITWDSTAVYSKIKADSVAITNAIIAAGSVDLDKDSTNEIQKLSLSGNVIKLSKNGDSVSIAAFKNMAKNGTSISGDSVVLGGTLDRPTTITTSATNTLTLAGLQSGASTDSIMTDSAGVVRHRSISTLKKEKVVVFTASYTVLADDEILIYRGTGPTATHTLTLPSAAANKDRVLQIVNMGKGDDIDLNLSTSVLTIGGGTDITETFIRNTVSGAGYGAGASFGNTMKIVSDGTQWIKIGL